MRTTKGHCTDCGAEGIVSVRCKIKEIEEANRVLEGAFVNIGQDKYRCTKCMKKWRAT